MMLMIVIIDGKLYVEFKIKDDKVVIFEKG